MALDVAMGAMVRIHMNFQVKWERITVTFNWHCIIEAFLDGNQILALGAIQVVLGETRHPNYAVSRRRLPTQVVWAGCLLRIEPPPRLNID